MTLRIQRQRAVNLKRQVSKRLFIKPRGRLFGGGGSRLKTWLNSGEEGGKQQLPDQNIALRRAVIAAVERYSSDDKQTL